MSRILFCRSGGGLPGLQAHAGMWRALDERGVHATHCHGTSAGAIVSAFDAAGRGSGYFAAVLDGLRTGDVCRERFAWKLRIPWIHSMLSSEPIRKLLVRHLPYDWFHLAKPLTTYMTNATYGFGDWCNGQSDDEIPCLYDAVLASMSIAGVFPHVVNEDGAEFSDGGTFNNCALPEDWRTFDEVWLLISAGRDDGKRVRGGLLTQLMRNIYFFGRGQIFDAMLETNLLGPNARLSATERENRTNELLDRGWATALVHSGDFTRPHVTRVNLLWPAFADDGALKFVPDLQQHAYEFSRDALAELFDAVRPDNSKAETKRIETVS